MGIPDGVGDLTGAFKVLKLPDAMTDANYYNLRLMKTNNTNGIETVLVMGGWGYVASALVPLLLEKGYQIGVPALYTYGGDVLHQHPNLEQIKGDIRDLENIRVYAYDSWATRG